MKEKNKNEFLVDQDQVHSMLLYTLTGSLLGNLLAAKRKITAGEDTIRTGQGFECCLIV